MSDDDVVISSVLGIYENEEGIKLSITRVEAKSRGSSTRNKESEEIVFPHLSQSQVLQIVDLLENWLKSQSYPSMDTDLEGVEGTHTFEIPGVRGETQERTKEVDDITVSVGENDIGFRYWDGDEIEWRDLSIPSSESVERGVPQGNQNVKTLYDTFYDFFTKEYSKTIHRFQDDGPMSSTESAVFQIEEIFDRFGEMAVPLKNRRGERPPLTMDDEYDVQYLLHSILLLHFEDVRREPNTERHSSVSPRIDFLIKDETIGIEVKRASENRTEKDFRGELSEDKEQYRIDTDIDTLLIFVYDPEKVIENKPHFEDSFEEETPQMTTRVTVTR